MAIKCDAWRAATDGTLHSTEKDATWHDLRVFSERMIRPTSTHLAANLSKNADEAIRLLTAYVKAHPGAGGGKVPSESQKGPVASEDPPAARAKPAPDTPMACCGSTFIECECDEPKVAPPPRKDD